MNRAYEGDIGRALAARYEAVHPDDLHKEVVFHFPVAPASVLDIGAGSGRDAAWLAEKGYAVLAVEPSDTMRAEGARLHPDARIAWLDDRLPGLDGVFRIGASFDLILLSAVWQHVAPEDRPSDRPLNKNRGNHLPHALGQVSKLCPAPLCVWDQV